MNKTVTLPLTEYEGMVKELTELREDLLKLQSGESVFVTFTNYNNGDFGNNRISKVETQQLTFEQLAELLNEELLKALSRENKSAEYHRCKHEELSEQKLNPRKPSWWSYLLDHI